VSAPAPTAAEVGELRALVVGREVPEVAHRLGAIRERLAEGAALGADDLELVTAMRARYGRELAELLEPED
jgi:hypothetical protein